MEESIALVSVQFSDLAVWIIAIAAVALLLLETIYLAAFTLFITTTQSARGRHGTPGVPTRPRFERREVVPQSKQGAL